MTLPIHWSLKFFYEIMQIKIESLSILTRNFYFSQLIQLKFCYLPSESQSLVTPKAQCVCGSGGAQCTKPSEAYQYLSVQGNQHRSIQNLLCLYIYSLCVDGPRSPGSRNSKNARSLSFCTHIPYGRERAPAYRTRRVFEPFKTSLHASVLQSFLYCMYMYLWYRCTRLKTKRSLSRSLSLSCIEPTSRAAQSPRVCSLRTKVSVRAHTRVPHSRCSARLKRAHTTRDEARKREISFYAKIKNLAVKKNVLTNGLYS